MLFAYAEWYGLYLMFITNTNTHTYVHMLTLICTAHIHGIDDAMEHSE